MSSATLWIKIGGSAALLAVAVLAGYLAQIDFMRRRKDMLSMANTCGGGVLITVALLHLLPELSVLQESSGVDFPIMHFTVLLGFITLLFLEKVLFQHEHYESDEEKLFHDKDDEGYKLQSYGSMDDAQLPYPTPSPHSPLFPPPSPHPSVFNEPLSYPLPSPSHSQSPALLRTLSTSNCGNANNLATPILLLIALSIHSLFEGMVMGIQKSPDSALSVFIAILCHKPVESLTLGSLMVKEGVSLRNYTILTIVLALVTPAGIFIGLGLTSLDTPEVVFGYFNAIATGSFLYISTTEILSDEFHAKTGNRFEKLKRFGSFLVGVIIIIVTEVLVHDPTL